VLKEEINLLKVELNDNEAKMSDDNAKKIIREDRSNRKAVGAS
jgi:hypothetical protein